MFSIKLHVYSCFVDFCLPKSKSYDNFVSIPENVPPGMNFFLLTLVFLYAQPEMNKSILHVFKFKK